MIKILLLPEVLNESVQESNSDAVELVEKCKLDPQLQAWTMATTVQMLADKGNAASQIKDKLQGISLIPVNARLSYEALESDLVFDMGLQLAALKMFKIDYLVGLDNADSVISCQQALELDGGKLAEKVDFLNLNLSLHPIFDQVDGWHMDIIQNTAFAGGNHVVEFEKEFADFCQTKHAVGVSNGTDALLFSLLAMGIGPGDEVITVPNTFIATTEAISQAGATPVFVDVLPGTYLMDPDLVEGKITEKTKALIPVHLYGQVVDMDSLLAIAKMHHLGILEDSCQAHGAVYKGRKAGSMGDVAAFSMYPGKNLGAFGEAGCVTTNDENIAETVRCLREHGQSKKYYHRLEGFNGRMDNVQAAALRAKLPLLNGWNDNRRRWAKVYQKNLTDIAQVTLPEVVDYSAHVFHLFVILAENSHQLSDFLKARNIHTAYHYPVPLHLQEAYKDRGENKGSFPVTEKCADVLLSLPMFPELTEDKVKRVCDEIREFYRS